MRIMQKKLSYFLIFFVVNLACCLNVFYSRAQVNAKGRSHDYGFTLLTNIEQFDFKDNSLKSERNTGFGVGLFYILHLDKLLGINFEIRSSRNYHNFSLHDQKSRTVENRLSAPVEIQYQFEETNLITFTGIEYSYSKRQDLSVFQLRPSTFTSKLGLKYLIEFKHFKIVPEVNYNLGLNNAVKNVNEFSGDVSARKSGFEFAIKFM